MVRINLYVEYAKRRRRYPFAFLTLRVGVIIFIVLTIFSLLYLNYIIKVYNERYAVQLSRYSMKFTLHNLGSLNEQLRSLERAKMKEYLNALQRNRELGAYIGRVTRLYTFLLHLSDLYEKEGWKDILVLKTLSIDMDTNMLEISELIRSNVNMEKSLKPQKAFLESQGFELVKDSNIPIYQGDQKFYLHIIQYRISQKAKQLYSWGGSG